MKISWITYYSRRFLRIWLQSLLLVLPRFIEETHPSYCSSFQPPKNTCFTFPQWTSTKFHLLWIRPMSSTFSRSLITFHRRPKLFNFLLEIRKSSIFCKLLNVTRPLYLLTNFLYKVHPISHFPYKAQLTSHSSIILFLLMKFPQIHPSSHFCQEVVNTIVLLEFIHCLISPRNGSENNNSFFEFIH